MRRALEKKEADHLVRDTTCLLYTSVEVPKTYDELTAACETFKAAGIAPFARDTYNTAGQATEIYVSRAQARRR